MVPHSHTRRHRHLAVLLLVLSISLSFGKKLEGWQDPEIEGSIQASGLRSATRNPKLFWGTTTTTVSTLSTTTACYTTGTIASSCSKKKRSIDDHPIAGTDKQQINLVIPSSTMRKKRRLPRSQPPQTPRQSTLTDLNQIRTEGRQEEAAGDPRFIFFYWYTSTVTSTKTTYTKTTTFTLTACTPAGTFAYAACG